MIILNVRLGNYSILKMNLRKVISMWHISPYSVIGIAVFKIVTSYFERYGIISSVDNIISQN